MNSFLQRHTMLRLLVGVALSGLGFYLVSKPFGIGYLPINLVNPPGGSLLDVIARMLVFGLGPLLGVIWQRKKGGRGIVGGLSAGISLYGGYSLFLTYSVRNDPFSLGVVGDFFVFSFVGAVNGITLGITAWSLIGISEWLLSKRRTAEV